MHKRPLDQARRMRDLIRCNERVQQLMLAVRSLVANSADRDSINQDQLDVLKRRAGDTAIANLAGAMGMPAFVLLPFAADWRWGARGSKTPWYPTAVLFRQSEPESWREPVECIAALLRSCLTMETVCAVEASGA